MNEYFSRGKELLKILTNNGFEAFFVGEAVRNTILEKKINKIEITTSAHIEYVKKIFKDCPMEDRNDHEVYLDYAGFNYIIHTFTAVEGLNKPSSLARHYSKNLLDDLANRDFSINAIAMSHSGKLTDAHDGYDDIKKKRITHIGNAKVRFYKDPSIMIKAFVLMSELNYSLSKKTRKAINKRKKYLTSCNPDLYIDDLKKVFEGTYAKKAIAMMNKLNIGKALPVFKKSLNQLKNRYSKVSFEEVLLMSYILNGQISEDYMKYISNSDLFEEIYELAFNNKKGKYDSLTLYRKGLRVCLEANYINYLLKRSPKREKAIKKCWDKLPIKSSDDLAISERFSKWDDSIFETNDSVEKMTERFNEQLLVGKEQSANAKAEKEYPFFENNK